MKRRDRRAAPVRVHKLKEHCGWGWYCRRCWRHGIAYPTWRHAFDDALVHLIHRSSCAEH